MAEIPKFNTGPNNLPTARLPKSPLSSRALRTREVNLVPLLIEEGVYEKLQAFYLGHQTTFFVVLPAAFHMANYRMTGAEDTTIGNPIANRDLSKLENLINVFVNIQYMRITINQD